jgi:hypothetical protein
MPSGGSTQGNWNAGRSQQPGQSIAWGTSLDSCPSLGDESKKIAFDRPTEKCMEQWPDEARLDYARKKGQAKPVRKKLVSCERHDLWL